MKKVTVVAYCDNVHEAGETLATIERTLSIDGSKPVELDLCPECDVLVLALMDVMERASEQAKQVKAEGKKAKAPKVKVPSLAEVTIVEPEVKPSQHDEVESKCPLCEHVSPRRTALGQHLRAVHNKGFRDLRKEGVQVA